MKLIDANILIRFITEDDKKKAKECKRLLVSSGEDLLLTELAVAEVVWVLETQYKISREDIHDTLMPIVSAPQLKVINGNILQRALVLYKTHSVDFIDAYHAAFGRWLNASSIYSYDEKDFRRLKFPREEP